MVAATIAAAEAKQYLGHPLPQRFERRQVRRVNHRPRVQVGDLGGDGRVHDPLILQRKGRVVRIREACAAGRAKRPDQRPAALDAPGLQAAPERGAKKRLKKRHVHLDAAWIDRCRRDVHLKVEQPAAHVLPLAAVRVGEPAAEEHGQRVRRLAAVEGTAGGAAVLRSR